jgi:hypothetical protein
MLRLGGSWTPEEPPSPETIAALWWEVGNLRALPDGAEPVEFETGYFAGSRYLYSIRFRGWAKGDKRYVDDADWVDQII